MIGLTLELPIRAALLVFDDVRVESSDGAYAELVACAERYRAAHDGAAAGDVPGVDIARALFRALGIDPTRRRPSSESLLRRALKGQPMPRISNLVDVGNWCSLDALRPLGLYDADRIEGDIVLRRGREGDGYEAINHRRLDLADRYLLADDRGAFGSPMTDSRRTAVTDTTRRAVILLYSTIDDDPAHLAAMAEAACARVVEWCGGTASAPEHFAGEDR